MRQGAARKRQSEANGLGRRVRELRKERGLTQRDLAAEAGIDAAYLCHLEGGRTLQNPTYERILALAGALGVRPSRLMPE